LLHLLTHLPILAPHLPLGHLLVHGLHLHHQALHVLVHFAKLLLLLLLHLLLLLLHLLLLLLLGLTLRLGLLPPGYRRERQEHCECCYRGLAHHAPLRSSRVVVWHLTRKTDVPTKT
jgi:hypothetical protein